MSTTQTASAVPLWKHFGWQGLILPSVVVLLLGGWAISKIMAGPDTAAIATSTGDATEQAVVRAVQQLTPSTEPAPPVTVPGYDYIFCSHVQAGDPTPCSPVLVYPPTEGARTLIGFQRGGIQGELSTANTRTIFDQIRNKYPAVNACSFWLGIERDAAMNPILTVYPSQAKAPAGAVQLLDCTPSAKATTGTIPTAGA